MDSNVDLMVNHVSKRYRIAHEKAASGGLLGRMRQMFRATAQEEFWAVRDASFSVRRGESVGIIGHNGAGKSTMLKMLSGITTPSEGEIQFRGRLAALLEVGSGFHPELTGRENIFLSGSILGMTRREIHSKLEEIIEFAGVRDFIDIPVKRFSSGMYVRLGFSIAAHLNPDIMLLDEVLAVGDVAFQQKCVERILAMRENGMTIVFISHDLQAVERVCSRTLVFDHGRIVFDGETREAIKHYNKGGSFTAAARKTVGDVAHVRSVEFFEEGTDAPVSITSTGKQVRARVGFECNQPVSKAYVEMFFNGPDNQCVCVLTTREKMIDLPAGHHYVEFSMGELVLGPKLYRIDVVINADGVSDPLEWLYGCAVLQVNPGRWIHGIFFHPQQWKLLTPSSSMDPRS